MPAKGDMMLGEPLATVTFKIPQSVLVVAEKHLRTLQRTTRYQRIGKSDCLRDIFMRGIDSIENPTQQFPVVIDPGHTLPLPTPSLVEVSTDQLRAELSKPHRWSPRRRQRVVRYPRHQRMRPVPWPPRCHQRRPWSIPSMMSLMTCPWSLLWT